MNETWRPIPGYEGLYEVSDQGEVRSTRRQGARGGSLRQRVSNGYPSVDLCVGSRRRAVRVHQLVLLAFVGPPPEGQEVLHADDDKLNPRLANLRYGTRSENIRMRAV